MILSGGRIREEIDKGRIEIEPYSESRLNPNSYNLSLHDELVVYEPHFHTEVRGELVTALCMDEEPRGISFRINADTGMLLYPGILYLARTAEWTHTDHFVPMIEGRSSLGRLGVNIHITAGFGDIGFAGYWTLEISVVQPIVIFPFIEVCQLYFHEITPHSQNALYKGSYNNSGEIKTSKMYLEVQKMKQERQ